MSEQYSYATTLYAIPFQDYVISSTGGSSYADLWSVSCTTLGRVELRAINIGQKSSAIATVNQQLDVRLYRGTTALGGGTSTPIVNTKGWPTAPVANSLAWTPSTNLASTASATQLLADASDYAGNYEYYPREWEEFTFDVGQPFFIRVSAPAVPVTLSGYVLIKEGGKLK